MKAKTIKLFFDVKAETDRQVGEVFECTEERFKEILAAWPEPLVERVSAPRKAAAKKAPAKAAKAAEEVKSEE